jgi:hypothetical protein
VSVRTSIVPPRPARHPRTRQTHHLPLRHRRSRPQFRTLPCPWPPPRSRNGPGTASQCSWPSIRTASTARTTSPTGKSNEPSTPETGRIAQKQAVPRTAGTALILSAICPCMAHTRAHGRPPGSRARPRPEPPDSITDAVFAAQSTFWDQQRASRAGCWADRIWPTHGPQRQQAVSVAVRKWLWLTFREVVCPACPVAS